MKINKWIALAGIAFGIGALSNCQSESKEWQLVWEENFNQPDSFDRSVWSKIPRGTADWNRHMSDFDSCYAMRDGKLVLRGIVNHSLPQDTAPVLTGGIYSKEIDIMERLNNDSIAYQTVHSYYTHVLGFKENPKQGGIGPINRDHYNVYAVELYPDSLSFYINDRHTFTYPRIKTKEKGQFPFNQSYYLLLDMQLGGSWVGKVYPEDLPVEMEIDWVRFYQK